MEESFAKQGWTNEWPLKRSCKLLLSICTGLLSDEKLDDRGIIYSRIKAILTDNKISDKEREHLEQTLSDPIGSTLQEISIASCKSTRMDPHIRQSEGVIKDNLFCFTSQFFYDTCKACESAVAERDGISPPSRTRTDLDNLVIGAMDGPSWKNTRYGDTIKLHTSDDKPVKIKSYGHLHPSRREIRLSKRKEKLK